MNDKAAEPYMVCDCKQNSLLGFDEYSNAVVSSDYMEIIKEFTDRITARVESIKAEREKRGVPLEMLTAADCDPKSMSISWENQVIVVKPERLSPEYRTADHQLMMCYGGFGSNPNSRGQAVLCNDLYDRTSVRWSRYDIAGVILPERMPEWAKEKLAVLNKTKSKDKKQPDPVTETTSKMDKEMFWQTIDDARKKAGSWQDMFEPLLDTIVKLDEVDIIRWHQIFREYSSNAYKYKLWSAAELINGTCTDDGFIDFRAWLIAQGKDAYLNALKNPDSLADLEPVKALANEIRNSESMPKDGYVEWAFFESLVYIAVDAGEKKYGKDYDIYDTADKNPLSENERTAIKSEIHYAKDIDDKLWEDDANWLAGDAKVSKAFPKLDKLFCSGGAAEKESVTERIKQSKQNQKSEKAEKITSKKKNKSEQEI